MASRIVLSLFLCFFGTQLSAGELVDAQGGDTGIVADVVDYPSLNHEELVAKEKESGDLQTANGLFAPDNGQFLGSCSDRGYSNSRGERMCTCYMPGNLTNLGEMTCAACSTGCRRN